MSKNLGRKIGYFFLTLYMSFATCFSFTFLLHSNITDVYWAKATEIRKIQNEKNTDYVSAFLKSDEENPTYYAASYFYRLQYISRYWNFDAPYTNNVFFKYKQIDSYSPLTINVGGEIISVDVICNLFDDAAKMFPIKLKYGSKAPFRVNNKCCEYSYLSTDLANKLGITELNYNTTKIDFIANRKKEKDVVISTSYVMNVSGVVLDNSLGVYQNYIKNKYYIFTNWSADLQTSMNSPDLNVMFYKDEMKNRYYISTIEKAVGKTLDFIYEDGINSKNQGIIHDRINKVSSTLAQNKTKNLVTSLITFFSLLLSVSILLIYLIKTKSASFLKYASRNFYLITLLAEIISIAIIHYLFPLVFPSYIITLSEIPTFLSLFVLLVIESLFYTFSEKIDGLLNKLDDTSDLKRE